MTRYEKIFCYALLAIAKLCARYDSSKPALECITEIETLLREKQ